MNCISHVKASANLILTYQSELKTGDTALAQALNGDFKGKEVTMFGPFTDADEVKFTESIKAFEEKSGIDIAYEGSKEFEATISVRVNGKQYNQSW